MKLPNFIIDAFEKVHSSWLDVLEKAVCEVALKNSNYFSELEKDSFLPTQNRLFAAFSQPMHEVRYILVGESPYPREDSATGYSFMDGAVTTIWSEKGFSKQVNRATSLRNFLKMLLVAENTLHPNETSGEAVAKVIQAKQGIHFPYITQLDELKNALLNHGFLLLNASLVFRKHVSASKEATMWMPFLRAVLNVLADNANQSQRSLPILVLWGKIAERLIQIEAISRFPQITSEHPYNLSFIQNLDMQRFFGKMNLLKK